MSNSTFNCLNPSRWRNLLVITGLIVGCAAKFVVASVLLFNLYQGTMKDMFNYSQTQVELLASVLFLGSVTGFLPGVFYDRFGSGWTSAIGLVITVGANLLIWSTTRSVEFYSANHWLMVVYFYMAGLGTIFTYITSVTTNLINFEDRHSGKIVGLLNCSYFVGGCVGVLVFYSFFTEESKDGTGDSRKYDFAGFILYVAINSCIVHLFCILFLKTYGNEQTYEELRPNKMDSPKSEPQTASKYDNNEEETEPGNIISDTNEATKCMTTKDSKCDRMDEVSKLEDKLNTTHNTNEDDDTLYHLSKSPLSITKILLTVEYQLVSWLFGLTLAVGQSYIANITVISKSVCLDRYDARLTVILHITNAICSAFSGFISDKLNNKLGVNRTVVLIGGIICFGLAQMLVVVFADKLTVLEIATVMQGLGHSVNLTISLSLVNELFFPGNLGRNIGIMCVLTGLILVGLQIVFGTLYDAQAQLSDSSSTHCYGINCIRGGMTVSCILVFLSLACAVVLHLKLKFGRRQHNSW